MRKYLTTESHDVLPVGLEFCKSENHEKFMICVKSGIYVHEVDFELDLAKGFYKEIQDPKWTDEQVEEIAVKSM